MQMLPRRRMTDHPTPAAGLRALHQLQAQHPIWDCKLLTACEHGFLTVEDFRILFSQYYLYSKNFTRYLAALIASCDSDLFRAQLTENLWEEGGGAEIDKRHAEIFRRFLCDGLGLAIEDIEHRGFTRYFANEYLDFCQRSSPLAASAFLSLGTEGIVAPLYTTLLAGLRAAGVADRHLEFFRIHIACDDAHALTLEDMMVSYFGEPDWFEVCRRAMNHALTLRLQFFDDVYEMIQQRRVAEIMEGIQARESLTPILGAGTSLLKASVGVKRILYSNRNDRLNIDFTVTNVPFSPQVLDPRIVRIPPGRTNENHKHAHETVFYIVAGSGRVVIDEEVIPVKAGDLVFVPRWSMHQTHNTSDTEMTVLAVADFNLTRSAFIGNYIKTARLRRNERDQHTTREASWSLPDEADAAADEG